MDSGIHKLAVMMAAQRMQSESLALGLMDMPLIHKIPNSPPKRATKRVGRTISPRTKHRKSRSLAKRKAA